MHSKAEPLDLMIAIVVRDHGEKIVKMYPEDSVPLHTIVPGRGTAKSELLDILGLERTEKDIVFSLIPHSHTPSILNKAANLLRMNRVDGGVAFAVPLTSATRLAVSTAAGSDTPMLDTGKEKNMKTEGQFEVIMCIVHHGYSDKVMDRARQAGATGGTVFHSRALGAMEEQKFIKITIQPEKETIMILTPADKRRQIMDAIASMDDFVPGAKGVIMSIPVTAVAGMGSSSTDK